jgi:hypothetical protein
LALAVPLSRFTPRVGGGSAFYVRQQSVAGGFLVGPLAGDPHLGMHLEKTSADLPAASPAGFAGLIFLPVSFRGVRVFRGSQLNF